MGPVIVMKTPPPPSPLMYPRLHAMSLPPPPVTCPVMYPHLQVHTLAPLPSLFSCTRSKSFSDGGEHLFLDVKPHRSFIRPSWLATACMPCGAVEAGTNLEGAYSGTQLQGYEWLGCPCTAKKVRQ